MLKKLFKFRFSISLVCLAIFILPSAVCIAQLSPQWVQRYNGTGNGLDGMQPNCSRIDAAGYLYIAGSSAGIGTNSDYITIKYSPAGTIIWSARYTGLGGDKADFAYAMEIDNAGNVYVTGRSRGTNGDFEAATVKYNSSGVQVWANRYGVTIPGDEWANAIAVDGSGNVIIGGLTSKSVTDKDYLTIKYTSYGVAMWTKTYDGPLNNDYDEIHSVAADISGNVYVTGRCGWSNAVFDMVSLRYNSFGSTVMATRYDGTLHDDDCGLLIRPDASGNFIVSGYSRETNGAVNITTIKFNSTGLPLWTKTYNGYGSGSDVPYDMELDNAGNVYVCGSSTGDMTSTDFITIKYNQAGTQLWSARVNGASNGSDFAQSLELDMYGNVYVTGAVTVTGQNYNFATIKYNGFTGSQMGSLMVYNGTGNDYDKGNSIALNSNGSAVYVCGPSIGSGTSGDIAIIKYSQLVGIENIGSEIPSVFGLSQNYPNPFNPSTKISFSLPVCSNVHLAVYDIAGKEVEVLVNQSMNSGVYEVDWNAAALSSGTYFYTLRTESYTETKKMVLVK